MERGLLGPFRSLGERPTEAEVEEIMSEADASGDGKLGYLEFAQYLSET